MADSRKYSEAGVAKQLKALVRECVENGVVLDRPKYKHFKDSKDTTRDEVAIGIVQLLLDTTYFCKATKVFISDFYMDKVDVMLALADMGIDLNNATVSSRIRSDLLKFVKDFGDKVIIDLFENTSASVGYYQYKLDELRADKEGKDCELEQLRALRVPYGIKSNTTEISDAQVSEFLELIRPYTPSEMERVEQSIDRKVSFYVRNLLVKGALGEKERKHLEMITSTLKVSDNKQIF